MKSWVSSAFSDSPSEPTLPNKKPKQSVNTRSLKTSKSSLETFVAPTKTTDLFDTRNKNGDLKTFLPLAERYRPKSRAELIVNKAKIDQLSQLLDNVIIKKKGTIIILDGPSGCGKNV